MSAWFESLFGAEFGALAMWITMVAGGLILAFTLLWMVRGTLSGTFIAGGRNRKPRLAVLDAVAVDTRRRLVLVRRDNVEHLILIGGPTDVVVEQSFQSNTPATTADIEAAEAGGKKMAVKNPQKPAKAGAEAGKAKAKPSAAAKTAQTAKSPALGEMASHASGTVRAREQAASDPRRTDGVSASAARPAPLAPMRSQPDFRTGTTSAPETERVASTRADLDSALLKELETTLERSRSNGTTATHAEDDIDKLIENIGRERN